MKKLFIAITIVCLVWCYSGIRIGIELTEQRAQAEADARIQAETDYYMRAVLTGSLQGKMTNQEAIALLRQMQWTHQAWADHPEWWFKTDGTYEADRGDKERALVRAYGKLIELIQSKEVTQ